MPSIGVWTASLLTLIVLSFVFRDNPFYRMAEHMYVGLSAGYFIAIQWHTVLVPKLFAPLGEGRLILIVPAILSALLFARFFTRVGWLSRWPLAIYVGVYAGINLIQYVQGDILPQVQATMLAPTSLAAIIIIAGTLTTLSYFFFSREHRGALGVSARTGMWFLMISFGAVFGTTVMARMSLLIGRVYFLLSQWLYPLAGRKLGG